MANGKYSAGIMTQSFWFLEFKKVMFLLQDGKTFDEIKRLTMEENLFGTSTENRAKRMYGYLSKRAKAFDEEGRQLFCNADLATQKVMTLLALLMTDRLYFEFVYEVYREKIILGTQELTDSDLNIFFRNKESASKDVAAWKESTIKHLKSTYTNFMTDAGLLTIMEKKKTITPPILDSKLEQYLRAKGGEAYIKAITGAN